MKKQQMVVSKPRIPHAVLSILHTKRGGSMKLKTRPSRSTEKRSFQREFAN